MKSKVIIIIPAYNEEASIQKTVELILTTGYDYIVINDGSSDNTSTVLKTCGYNHIDLISNLGIGGAMQTGYKYAFEQGYDVAVQFDADGQHDANFLSAIIQPIEKQNADLVIGSCFVNKKNKAQRSSRLRRFGIHFLSNVITILSKKRIYDPTSGFRAANRKVITQFAKDYPLEYPEPISNFKLLKSKHYKIAEVPVKMNKRIAGKSSISTQKTIYAGFNVLLSILILIFKGQTYD